MRSRVACGPRETLVLLLPTCTTLHRACLSGSGEEMRWNVPLSRPHTALSDPALVRPTTAEPPPLLTRTAWGFVPRADMGLFLGAFVV